MKLFRVVTEKDGKIEKKPGETTTEIIRSEYRYAAENMAQVWEAIQWMERDDDLNQTIIAIVEDAPSITVLKSTEPPND